MPYSVGDQIEVVVDQLSFNGGRGVGRIEGYVVFIPYTIPGERVVCEITKAKKSYAEARVIEIIQPSNKRVEPKCQYFTKCGGCSLQHINENDQADFKKQTLTNELKKLDPAISLTKFIPSPKMWHYRNRVQFHAKKAKVYFRGRKTNALVEIKACKIADEKINRTLQNPQNQWSKLNNERLELVVDKDGHVQGRTKAFKNSIRSFSQVNTEMNKILTDELLRVASPLNPEQIYDLYCGSGNFSFALKKLFPKAQLTAVELSEAAIAEARQPAVDNINFITSSVADFLKASQPQENDLILLDPPRTGLDDFTRGLLFDLKVSDIIYISCDPMTFIRDTKCALQQGYKIKQLIGFDMFPQTDHIELLSHLHLAR